MKKLITSIVLLLSCCFTVHAQMLEQVELSGNNLSVHTYVTGINNAGSISGYYQPITMSVKVGFIITENGKFLRISNTQINGATSSTVQSINDHDVAIVAADNGGVITLYRAYVNVLEGKFDSVVQCIDVQQPNTTPGDMNNLRDIVGGYTGIDEFMFVKHDSTIPNGSGNQPWIALRYNNSYNTFCGGINDANKVCGYYINGTAHCGFVYDNIAHTYNVLNTINKRHIWDINNNNRIVGEYYNTTNNVWKAFISNVGTGGYTSNVYPDIFHSDTTSSVATGINDNGTVVGNFYNYQTGRWTGFIYHPNLAEYRLPGWDYMQHAWKISNDNTAPTTCWTPAYIQGINYMVSDPYTTIPGPLATQAMLNANVMTTVQAERDPTWKSFATEYDITHAGLSSDPDQQNFYTTILKPKMFDKWIGSSHPSYTGHCFGFAFSSLLRCYLPAQLNSWYNIPGTTNLTTVLNTDNNALFAIERGLTKQTDAEYRAEYLKHNNETLWHGLYRLKTNMLKTAQTANPMPMILRFSTDGYHAILPYKIRTPRKLPFVGRDTVFVYDSNNPTDSNEYVGLRTSVVAVPFSEVQFAFVGGNAQGADNVLFHSPGIRFFQNKQFSLLKSTSGNTYDPTMTVGLYRSLDYNIMSNGNMAAASSGGNFTYDSSLIGPIFPYNTTALPCQHTVDTAMTLNIMTTNYTENAMVYNQINKSRSMGLSRVAQLSETDHSTQKNGLISYGNPDNVTKYLTGFMREDDGTALQQGVNIMVTNICAEQGDSIVTSSPSTFTYNITKLNGTANCTYHLTVYAAYNGEVSLFQGDAEIQPNSSHTVDPYYQGNNGTQVAVIVDNGNDGSTDDTLFVVGWPVRLNTPIKDDNIKVYPNPVTEQLNIELASIHDNYEIRLTDAVGKIVYKSTGKNGKMNIPMTQYPTGMYILQITDTKGHILYLDKITKQ